MPFYMCKCVFGNKATQKLCAHVFKQANKIRRPYSNIHALLHKRNHIFDIGEHI